MSEPDAVVGAGQARVGGWRVDIAFPAIAGILAALGQAPFDLWPVGIVGLMFALQIGYHIDGWRDGLRRGFFFGLGFGLTAMHWIVEPFLVDAARYGWMAPFGLGAMAAGFGVFAALAFILAAFVAPRPGAARMIAVVLALTLAEIARSYLFTGLPWVLTAYLWIGTPLYRIAAFVGPHGLTLVTLGIAAALAWAQLTRQKWLGLAVIALIAGGFLSGFLGPTTEADDATADARPVLRLVQPNVPQDQKWQPDLRESFFQRLLDLTGGPSDADIVIWPEVAVTFLLNDPAAPYDRISDAAAGRQIIFGGQRIEAYRAYNSAIALDGEGVVVALYDKHHLVPFGEYTPGGALAEGLGLRGLAEQLSVGFSGGPGPAIIDLGPGRKILPMICYEAIFPQELRRVAVRPDWMLHMTNDAWFGGFAGPRQHLAQSRARAIEFGLPVVRVANTGITALIDAHGRVLESIGMGKPGTIEARVPAALAPTLYWRMGDNPVIALVFVALCLMSVAARRKSD